MTNAEKGASFYCDLLMHHYHRLRSRHTAKITLVFQEQNIWLNALNAGLTRDRCVLISNHETALTKEWYMNAKELHSVKSEEQSVATHTQS